MDIKGLPKQRREPKQSRATFQSQKDIYIYIHITQVAKIIYIYIYIYKWREESRVRSWEYIFKCISDSMYA